MIASVKDERGENVTDPKDKHLSAVEAARRLGIGLDYLYSLLWTGKLKAHKVGKRWRIPAEAVVARLKERAE
jgi:excisionase family DNA binding protein